MHNNPKRILVGAVLSIGFGAVGYAANPGYTLTNLGDFGGDFSDALAVNRNGRVVGWSCEGAPLFECFAFLWLPDPLFGLPAGINNLGTLPIWDDTSIAWDVNNSTQVAGFSCDTSIASDACRAFLWLPQDSAFLGLTAGMHELPPLPGDDFSYGFGMNNLAEVVGGSSTFVFPPYLDAWLWLPLPNYFLPQGTHQVPRA